MLRSLPYLRAVLALMSLMVPLQPGLGAARAPGPAGPAQAGADEFVPSAQSLGGETGNGVALGDLDGDGDLDAFVANDYSAIGSEANHVWLNRGDGFFDSGPVLGTDDGYAVALGDLDGDGDLDALVVGYATPSQSLAPASVSAAPPNEVWLNQGGAQGGSEGTFAAGVSFGTYTSYGVALGDVDNDADLDALVVGTSNQIWLNNGSAAYSAGPAFPFQYSEAAGLADLDGDSFLDAIIADSAAGSNTRVWWNDGNWTPGPGSFTLGDALPTTALMVGLATADLDDDEQLDIFLAGSGPDQIYWNEGIRDFSTTGPLPVDDSSWAVALADVDGDELPDAVVGNISAAPNRLWHNLGGRVFTVTQEFGDETGLYWARGLGLADLNADGSPDLFEVTTAEDRVWFNAAGLVVIPNEPGWQVQLLDTRGDAGYASSLALDANGYPHISYGRLFQDPDDVISYLMYARWDGVRWHREVVGNSVSDTALAVDAAGEPQIAFSNGAGTQLMYAGWNGQAWQVQTVDSLPFPQTLALGALRLDSNGFPHIVYNTFSNSSPAPELLKYAHWDGAAWQIQTVDTGLVYDSALALDAAGVPHVGYAFRQEFDTYVVKYAVWDGAGWLTEVLDGDAVPDGGVFLAALALDAGGSPHLGYVLDDFTSGDVLKYAQREGAGWTIQPVVTIDPDHKITDVALDLNAAAQPHLVYYLSDPLDGGYWIQYQYWNDGAWQAATLGGGETTTLFRDQLVAMALDSAGNLHASYYDTDHEDLRYVTWAPNWQIRTIPEAGTLRSPDIAVRRRLDGAAPQVGYYSQTGGQVKLASWDEPWTLNPLDFVSSPVTDLAVAAGHQFEHVSYYDADNQRLMYAYWNGTAWNPEVVDEAGDVGRYNDLVLPGNNDGTPRIAYWDATSLRVKLARPNPDVAFWNIYPNNAGPALDAQSGRLSAAAMPGGDFGVAYYDAVNGDLRLAVWHPQTGTWSDERVDGAAADVGALNALQTDWTDGAPVLAYLGQGELRWAYKLGGVWHSQPVPGTDEEEVTGLSLELGLDSRQHARIAYTTASGSLNVATLSQGAWKIEVVASGAGAALSEVASALDDRPHLAYLHAAGGLHYAFRSATLNWSAANPAAPPTPTGGDYNPLDPCGDVRSSLGGSGLLRQANSAAPSAAVTLNQAATLGDEAIFGGLHGLFAATPNGQAYIDLYWQHGAEMGRLGLDDPGLLWDASGTLQNFLPGLEALVTGRGDEVMVTQAMVDDALDIWQRLAAAGSPALAGAIQAELAKYNNLQDFVGLSFDDWARAINVNPPPETTYLPAVFRP